jgi:hypothetical protein
LKQWANCMYGSGSSRDYLSNILMLLVEAFIA